MSVGYQRRLARKLGWQFALRYRSAALGVRLGWRGRLLQLHPPNLLHPIWLRIHSTDADVYEQVLKDEQYWPVAKDGDVAVIVDCGANVGYASAYLLSRFPRARVIAIEPFPANAELCRRNLAPYGSRAMVIDAAIWSRCTKLKLENRYKEWGVGVRPLWWPGETGDIITGIDLPSLRLKRIDLLKIDIEGSEAELFAHDTERWLPSVSNIAIELHGAECERQFRIAMKDYRYVESRSGDLTICRGIKCL